jgi:hypothetical protein
MSRNRNVLKLKRRDGVVQRYHVKNRDQYLSTHRRYWNRKRQAYQRSRPSTRKPKAGPKPEKKEPQPSGYVPMVIYEIDYDSLTNDLEGMEVWLPGESQPSEELKARAVEAMKGSFPAGLPWFRKHARGKVVKVPRDQVPREAKVAWRKKSWLKWRTKTVKAAHEDYVTWVREKYPNSQRKRRRA